MRALGSAIASALLLAVLVGPVGGADEAGFEAHAPTLRLVDLKTGYRSIAPKRDLTRLPEADLFKRAKAAGVDLRKPRHPLLVAQYRKGRLFYVFYKAAERAFGDRPYVIQRIQKTERTWKDGATEPEIRTTYQVEVFKTYGGAVKRHDQHYGSYGLRDVDRREIVKEYEIGIGEIPGECEGTEWPYSPGKLFRYIHPYAEEKGPFDDVRFLASTQWSLTVEFDKKGGWSVRSPEFAFDAPDRMPALNASIPKLDAASKGVVLLAGKGLSAQPIGTAGRAELDRRLGAPLQVTTFAKGNTSVCYPGAVVAGFGEDGTLRTLGSSAGFSGRLKSGLRHGDGRWKVAEVLGLPQDQDMFGWTWRYDGVTFWFDGFDRVSRIHVR